MRDLKKDLEFILTSAPAPHEVKPKDQWAYFIWEAIEGWPEAVRRAMLAERCIEELRANILGCIDAYISKVLQAVGSPVQEVMEGGEQGG